MEIKLVLELTVITLALTCFETYSMTIFYLDGDKKTSLF